MDDTFIVKCPECGWIGPDIYRTPTREDPYCYMYCPQCETYIDASCELKKEDDSREIYDAKGGI